MKNNYKYFNLIFDKYIIIIRRNIISFYKYIYNYWFFLILNFLFYFYYYFKIKIIFYNFIIIKRIYAINKYNRKYIIILFFQKFNFKIKIDIKIIIRI